MTAARTRNVFVACLGLLAVLAMVVPLSTLLPMVKNGELPWLRLFPLLIGMLLLFLDSVALLFRRPEHGWVFALAAIFLLLGMWWLRESSSVWPWFAVIASATGAVYGFRKERGDEAVD
ncbi:hypothetical protein [Dyella sp. C11]|uniref:hypothetical protein n=1 Tax=Dyella sp. C11 TaxID=2126991 RepID=UPI0013005315|nr:hypothetical protein [Dyella sp. C11]